MAADGTKVPAGQKLGGEDLPVAFQIGDRRRNHRPPAVENRVVGRGIGYVPWQEVFAPAATSQT
jgi:hypothetical protein